MSDLDSSQTLINLSKKVDELYRWQSLTREEIKTIKTDQLGAQEQFDLFGDKITGIEMETNLSVNSWCSNIEKRTSAFDESLLSKIITLQERVNSLQDSFNSHHKRTETRIGALINIISTLKKADK